MNFALSPVAAAAARFWQSEDSALFLLAASSGLPLIALSHPCFAAEATAEFVPAPPEPLELVELPELLVLLVAGALTDDVLDAGAPADDVFDAAELELLLPQPATSAPPTARSATTENSLLTIWPPPGLNYRPSVDGHPQTRRRSPRNHCPQPTGGPAPDSLKSSSNRSHLGLVLSTTTAARGLPGSASRHNLCAIPIFAANPAVALICAGSAARKGEHRWAACSAGSAIAMTGTAVLFGAAFGGNPRLARRGGVFQRLSIATGFGWLSALSLRALRRSRHDPRLGRERRPQLARQSLERHSKRAAGQ